MKYFIILFMFPFQLFAQSVYVPLNSDLYHLVDRYEIKRKKISEHFNSSVRPYTRKSVVALVDSVIQSEIALSRTDKFNLSYCLIDNREWTLSDTLSLSKKSFPFFKHLYRTKGDLYAVKETDFDLHVNPVVGFLYGKDNLYVASLYTNTRGAEIRGILGNKVGFYTFLTDNQIKFPYYVNERIAERRAIPSEGFYKIEYISRSSPRYDFFTARGYLTFEIIPKITSLQFGHDRFFIGNGYRSLILSDYAPSYLFLKLDTRVWRLHYTNLFTRMMANNVRVLGRYPRKYLALHQLTTNITNHLSVSIFESVVFSRQDSMGNNPLEIDYLNPIIFYRAVEHWLGDPDNVLLGFDFKWNLAKKFRIYGQAVLDELLLKEFFKQTGWWGNKQALQMGLIYVDVLKIKNLDIQLEHNIVRPFTYTHFGINTPFMNHQHYNQPLAHALGANFREYIGILRYQPFPRISLTAKQIWALQGKDQAHENFGSDIFKDYLTRSPAPNSNQPDYGHKIAQGNRTVLYYTSVNISYMIKHNLFIDFQTIRRIQNSSLLQYNYNNLIWQFSVRWNLPPRLHEF
ncbi:MAG: hypothetical protein NZM38_02060 [Cytophagales bacterium]|nr:hypothetical protein [Cytophagales bacterium]MDW8383536.1 hypothetical protein [Flammeovirgaceae bacterium]